MQLSSTGKGVVPSAIDSSFYRHIILPGAPANAPTVTAPGFRLSFLPARGFCLFVFVFSGFFFRGWGGGGTLIP